MQRIIGFLRQGSRAADLAPQPSLKQLDRLVREMQEAGLPVEVKIEGEEKPLPPSIDLSAYRIVQEALTNSLKHAGPSEASVTIIYRDDSIELDITDSGRGSSSTESQKSRGTGLVGMRERVSLHGGEFKAGNTSGPGFTVHATLPLLGSTI
jgi:signal transduction histidine kinase